MADEAAIRQLADSFRNVRNRSLYLDGERKPVQGDVGDSSGATPTTGYGWFTHEESIRSFSQRSRLSARHQVQPEASWMLGAVLALYDHTTQYGWYASTQQVRMGAGARYQRDTNTIDTWVTTIQDQTVRFSGISQLTDSFRNVRDRSLYLDAEKHPVQGEGGGVDTTPVLDPSQFTWSIDSQRVPGRKYWTGPWTGIDWIRIPSTVFDPATVSWSTDSQRPVRGLRPPMSWTKSGYFVAVQFDPARQFDWSINSQRVPAPPYWTSPSPTNEWIPPETYAAFDPAQQSWVVNSQRVPGKPYWTSAWIGTDWITPETVFIYNPAIQDWTIQTSAYKSRAWRSDSPQQQAWMVPSAVIDQQLFPATALPSHRLWNKAVGRWQPDLDNAWLEENPVVPNTFNVSFATESNSLNDQGGSPVGSS